MVEFESDNPYNELTDGDDFNFKGWERIYDETFLGYYELLLSRSARLTELEKDTFDYSTYRDMCLVMIRAILIESERLQENYTIQNFLKRHSRPDLESMVSDYLNQNINRLMTLRETLKICVDKFIAHNDTIVHTTADGEEQINTDLWFKRDLYLSDIKRDNYPFTIEGITAFIKSIILQVELPSDLTSNSIAYRGE